jgi:DNA-binding MarR family transcriptional regulator
MDTPARLSRVLGPLRRTVLRRTRDAAALPDLSDAQVELLRTLDEHAPIGVREAAQRLRISPSTVSNLVRSTTAAGLVDRRPSPTDRRAAELVPTTLARHLLDTYDEASRTLLEAALAHLSVSDRRAIERAIPALERLLDHLQQPTSSESSSESSSAGDLRAPAQREV